MGTKKYTDADLESLILGDPIAPEAYRAILEDPDAMARLYQFSKASQLLHGMGREVSSVPHNFGDVPVTAPVIRQIPEPHDNLAQDVTGQASTDANQLSSEGFPRASATELPTGRSTLSGAPGSGVKGPAWREFERVYQLLIYSFACKRLQEAEAEELTQDVYLKVIKAIPGFRSDREKGSFRGWLFSFIRNEFARFAVGSDDTIVAAGGSDDTVFQELANNLPEREEFDREFERSMKRWAAEQVRDDFDESAWLAFWKTEVEGKSLEDAAAELDTAVGVVAFRQMRVWDRVSEVIKREAFE